MIKCTVIVWSPTNPFQLSESMAEPDGEFLQNILHCFCSQKDRTECEGKKTCCGFAPGVWGKKSFDLVFAVCKKYELSVSVELFNNP